MGDKPNKRSSPKERRCTRTAVYDAFLKHQVPLKRFLARYLHNVHDIEDVIQEAFLRAYSAEQNKVIEQPKSFLFRIAKHVALTQLTQKSRRLTDSVGDFQELGVLIGEDSAEDEFIARQTIGLHCEAVAELPPQCRRVYLMRKVYGMSHQEIAEHLGIAVSTVENHLTKGLAHCDRYIRERTDPEFQAQPVCRPKNAGSAQ